MSLVEHAEREMQRLGWEEGEFPNGEVLALIREFADQGHSGGSAAWTLEVFGKLARYEPLSPLTDDPAEWIDRSDVMGEACWQSARRPDAFSTDGGRTHYLLDEPTTILVSEAA